MQVKIKGKKTNSAAAPTQNMIDRWRDPTNVNKTLNVKLMCWPEKPDRLKLSFDQYHCDLKCAIYGGRIPMPVTSKAKMLILWFSSLFVIKFWNLTCTIFLFLAYCVSQSPQETCLTSQTVLT